jgi:hypothetical protein
MKLARLLLSGCVLSLGMGMAASSYTVKVVDPTWIGQTELKPGDYKVQIEGQKAQLKMGKTVIEVPAKMETGSTKYSFTQLGTKVVDGKAKLEEIDFGGTNARIVFTGESTTSAGY